MVVWPLAAAAAAAAFSLLITVAVAVVAIVVVNCYPFTLEPGFYYWLFTFSYSGFCIVYYSKTLQSFCVRFWFSWNNLFRIFHILPVSYSQRIVMHFIKTSSYHMHAMLFEYSFRFNGPTNHTL